ncbi:C2 domain-containing protein [Hordeum vulgare]|nr:C2 domain-containing protein [Hordeum vulgare]
MSARSPPIPNAKQAWMVSLLKLWRVFQALDAFKVQHDGNAFHISHCWTIVGEEKFKAQYVALLVRGGKEVVEYHGDGEKAWPRGKTNSKEDKRDETSIALLEKVEGMISKKDMREEKRRQEKEEQMNAFMESKGRGSRWMWGGKPRCLSWRGRSKPRCSRSRPRMPIPRRKKWPCKHEDRREDHEG